MDNYKKTILKKLSQLNCWDTIHKTENTIIHGHKRNEHGNIKTALHELVKEGYVVKIPHHPDNAYYLNRKRKQEIYDILHPP